MNYLIKRGVSNIYSVKPTGQQSKKVMGENTVTMQLLLASTIDLRINDYVDVFTERYFLLDLADVKKTSRKAFNYTITLKGWQYKLAQVAYLFPDSDNNYTLAGQTIMANLEQCIDLLIINANRDQSGWVKGIVDATDYQQVSFNSNDTYLTVLATLADKFKVEWWVDGQTIHMTKRGDVEAFTWEYGKGNGLYDIERITSQDKTICTRLYCYGSSDNLPADYKGYSDKLKLPGALPYIEKNVYVNDDPAQGVLYGVIEHTEVFEDIRPERFGLVTTVIDKFTFVDSDIDFNVNSQLLGVTAKITFNTGQLAGYTFELNSFDNATKAFKINVNKDEKAFIVPSDDLKPAVGDQYVITDIAMPSTYIDAAEAALLAKAQEYLGEAANPIVNYNVTPDPLNFQQRNITLKLGNYVPTIDTDLGLNANLRIAGFTRDLQITSKYTAELAEVITVSPIVRSYVGQENLKKKVTTISKGLNLTYNNALQAKATAEGVKQITDFWGVTIDPAHGIVASGTLLVGAGAVGNAGITGVVDNVVGGIDKSVRIFVGAAYEDKEIAPFRVTDDGKMYAANAEITGTITASSGKIGNWNITAQGLENISTDDASIVQVKNFTGGKTKEARIGTNIGGSTYGSYVAVFINDEPGTSDNVALYARASGGASNQAAVFEGDVAITGAIFTDDGSGLRRGIGGVFQYQEGSDHFKFTFENGILVKQEPV